MSPPRVILCPALFGTNPGNFSEVRFKASLYLKDKYLTVREIADIVDRYYDYIGPDWDDKTWPSGRYKSEGALFMSRR
jgi:hypothetical protein